MMINNKMFHLMGKLDSTFRLNEELLPKDKKNEIVTIFIKYVISELGLDNEPNVTLCYDDSKASEMKSFGQFTPSDEDIFIVAANRNLADILRTLGHELIHYKQLKENKLKKDSNETGSSEENEANALAGVLMRNFGKMYPIIFE